MQSVFPGCLRQPVQRGSSETTSGHAATGATGRFGADVVRAPPDCRRACGCADWSRLPLALRPQRGPRCRVGLAPRRGRTSRGARDRGLRRRLRLPVGPLAPDCRDSADPTRALLRDDGERCIAVNNVLPGRIGTSRARWLGLDARMPAGKAFGTVILDRAFDLVVLVGLLAVGIAALRAPTGSSSWRRRGSSCSLASPECSSSRASTSSVEIANAASADPFAGSSATPWSASPSPSDDSICSCGWDSALAPGRRGRSRRCSLRGRSTSSSR